LTSIDFDDDDPPSDELMDELMSVLSLMSPEWRTAVAALDGKTMADLDQAIAHWKAERMQ
jgi:hypothetical protein